LFLRYVFSADNKEESVNVVTLIGNLATDVDLRELDGDRRVATFLLAVDRRTPDGKADFVRVSVWNKQAEICSQYLEKGKLVGVDGRLRSRSWEDEAGKRRSAVEVAAHQVEFLSPRDGSPSGDTPFQEAAAA
jgi:single-strand DNA-binding protein